MILEYLQPDPSILDGLTVVVRALYYVATIGAAGLAMFAIGFGHRLEGEEAGRLRRTLLLAIAAGLALSVLALGLRVLVLTAGASVADPDVWAAVMRSRIGDAFWLRAGGLLLVAAAATAWRAGPAIAAAGALLVLASYAAMGHSMLYGPRQEIAGLVVLHLAVVAFWVGSLPPLLWVARRRDGASAAALIEAWSRAATIAVLAMIVTGLLLTWYLTVRLDRILDAWHGWALAWKVAAVLAALGLALGNRLRHTPALARGEPGAGMRLAAAIRLEIIVVALAFYAAAEMVSVHPVDYGHRVQS
ncbi:copper resistance protein [Roseomonas alkaliterrae]|uniref:Putative copper export protein n=1 Tax=Neoroseomonas alkaliterrae TaxID=1452450 RepID=A0A840Y401_9PROT|nr:CopD family protein [Neoroseomonas alkaliterrae]MBB5688903.1 putative copper export protein [Neoroseomonas alkaliterrae]MBR0677285.1 copper resistance protein [Neoroseomonas alkaliterrae]